MNEHVKTCGDLGEPLPALEADKHRIGQGGLECGSAWAIANNHDARARNADKCTQIIHLLLWGEAADVADDQLAWCD